MLLAPYRVDAFCFMRRLVSFGMHWCILFHVVGGSFSPH